jgi:uncharacterized membrane protein YidH (DUF202 family)
MEAIASANHPVKAKTTAWNQVVVGYSVAAIGLVVLLTTNGASGISTAITIATAFLIAIGLLLPTAGMLRLRRVVDARRKAARRGFALQSLGLVGLLLGVIPMAVSASLPVLFARAVLILISATAALAGGLLRRRHSADIGGSNRRGIEYLILGTALIFAGVGVILWSNVAFYFLLSDLGNTVFTDVGAAISACGCVIAAYAFFAMPYSQLTERANSS